MIAIIDYGMGNLRSVQKALETTGVEAKITQDSKIILSAEKIILPGVGAMSPAMDKLSRLNLIETIKKSVQEEKPFLGICLGFQLLFEDSNEGGNVKGLGLIQGHVKRFESLKVPHIGWNQLQIKNKSCCLMKGVDNGTHVYFCHSYFATVDDQNLIVTSTDYGVDFTSSICKNNVFGVQFHPEKSQTIGLKILKNFVELKL